MPRPKLQARWCPCYRSQRTPWAWAFYSIWNEQNSGPITRPREPLRTGDGPTPQASLRGTTGQAPPTRAAPWRPFPPQGLVPAPSPQLSSGLALSYCCGFRSFPQTGLLCPLPIILPSTHHWALVLDSHPSPSRSSPGEAVS